MTFIAKSFEICSIHVDKIFLFTICYGLPLQGIMREMILVIMLCPLSIARGAHIEKNLQAVRLNTFDFSLTNARDVNC